MSDELKQQLKMKQTFEKTMQGQTSGKQDTRTEGEDDDEESDQGDGTTKEKIKIEK